MNWDGWVSWQMGKLGQGMSMRVRVSVLVEDRGIGSVEHAETYFAVGRHGRQGVEVLRRRARDGDIVVKGKMRVLVVRRIGRRAAWQSMNQHAGRRLELSRCRVHIFLFSRSLLSSHALHCGTRCKCMQQLPSISPYLRDSKIRVAFSLSFFFFFSDLALSL